MKPFHPKKQHGQVFVVVALSLVLLAGAVGLAVDSGLGYLIKAKLNAAADAAAIAGARAVSKGATESEQRAEAISAAEKFFAANYPNGYLGSSKSPPEIGISFNVPTPGSITVDVAARATVPVAFMGVMGFNLLDIKASAQTIRKDLDLAFVMDTSSSMSPVGTEVQQQASAFLDRFSVTTDRVSLIHFSIGAEVDAPIRIGQNRGFDRQTMVRDINAFRFNGLTNSAEGFWHGRNQLNRIVVPNRSSLRVIVFFSDGSPNSFASFFNFRIPGKCTLAGAISTNDDTVAGVPRGLWDNNKQNTHAAGACYDNTNITSDLTASGLPAWYNAHDINDREFPVIVNTPRVVTNDTSTPEMTFTNVNRASKNLVESMAARARSEGIHVLTLGLGSFLTTPSGPFASVDDTGENLLKCMANTPDALPRCKAGGANQPVGVYCHAATAGDLQPCFAMMASEILRITR